MFRFSFPSPYEVINRIKLKSKSHINWDSPLWLGQHLMFIQSIRDYPDELFNESSSNTLILRMRWDTFIHPKLTLWDFVDVLFFHLHSFLNLKKQYIHFRNLNCHFLKSHKLFDKTKLLYLMKLI